ncbi:MAG: tetratricopeptide repeat protein [Verrucomicrobiota bacterium]
MAVLLGGCSSSDPELLPNRRERFLERGIQQFERGDFRSAAASFNKFLSYEPNVWGYHLRGRSQAELGLAELALADYQRALDIDPGNASVHRARGWLYFTRGDFEEAADDYWAAFEHEPGEPESLSFGAWSALGGGNFTRALELARTAQRRINWTDDDERDGNDAAYNAIVAYVSLQSLGYPDRARAYVRLALKRTDPNVWPYDALLYYDEQISREELLGRTLSSGAETEARTYLAIDDFLHGRLESAQAELDWIAANGNKIYYEYYIALALLDGRLLIPPEAPSALFHESGAPSEPGE